MAVLKLTQTFAKAFTSQMPDEEKDNVFRAFQFRGKFKLYPQTEEVRLELENVQKEKGLAGFLDKVLVDVEIIQPIDTKFENEDGSAMQIIDFVKLSPICQQDATLAFWEVVNKGAEEKNSKKSRGR